MQTEFPWRPSDGTLSKKLSEYFDLHPFAVASRGGLYVQGIKSIGVRTAIASTLPDAVLKDSVTAAKEPWHFMDWNAKVSAILDARPSGFTFGDDAAAARIFGECAALMSGDSAAMGSALGDDIARLLILCGAKVR